MRQTSNLILLIFKRIFIFSQIWFQNKRARCRRRVNNNNMNQNTQPFVQASPMLPPVTPYGVMPTRHMMTSSPIPGITSYYHRMLGSPSSNNIQRLPGQFSTNEIPSNFQGSNHSATFQNHAFPAVSLTSFVPPMSSA